MYYLRVFTAVTVKNAFFWNVMSRISRYNQRFGSTYSFHHQGNRSRLAGNVSNNYQLTRATLRDTPEDGVLYSHRHENLKSSVIYLF
jgi:hypothetical protein